MITICCLTIRHSPTGPSVRVWPALTQLAQNGRFVIYRIVKSAAPTLDPAKKPPARSVSSLAALWIKLIAWLNQPVSGSSLALFRICVGLIMALEAYSLCRPSPGAISSGASPLETYYTGAELKFHFPFAWAGWLPMLPPKGIYALVGLQGIAGLMMAAGFLYRFSATAVFLSWGYLWLVESTRTYWQSHYYLEFLTTFLMIWMPAARRYSVDGYLRRNDQTTGTIPFWPVLLLRGQLVIAYFYAGVAKLTTDWILDAVPMRWFLQEGHVTAKYAHWLSAAQIGAFQQFVHSPALAYFFSWTGLVFDLTVGFLLLFRRTRLFAFVCMVLFHCINHFLIFDDIGWFPLLGATTALIFLDTDWPERVTKWLKRPHVRRPDSGWAIPGAVLIPGVGALLGWRLAPSARIAGHEQRPLPKWVAPFFVIWLSTQAVIPLRHFFIAGDGRFTYEGMSFSWRLKSEMRHSYAAQLYVHDPAIITQSNNGSATIHWNEWRGEKVLYRQIPAGPVEWEHMPEIVVLREPMAGERIIFNPVPSGARTVNEALERARAIWNALYGRTPYFAAPPVPIEGVLHSIADGLKAGGQPVEAGQMQTLIPLAAQLGNSSPAERASELGRISAALARLCSLDGGGELKPFLRRLPPFAFHPQSNSSALFLVIEDKPLFDDQKNFHLSRSIWKQGPATLAAHSSFQNIGAEPLVIFTEQPGPEARDTLPEACVMDRQDHPEAPPEIWWNTIRDASISKALHISTQPFYLRRYARRVAALWETAYHRRPAVTAATALSLNGRPHQELVDPTADLASVTVSYFRHNRWVRDLQTGRIPRAALDRPWEGKQSGY